MFVTLHNVSCVSCVLYRCVLKPPELAPTTTYLLCECLDKVGLPKGVIALSVCVWYVQPKAHNNKNVLTDRCGERGAWFGSECGRANCGA